MTMEVSYPFHSHLIGRSGQAINGLMKETETRIHFPDRNRIAGQSKINSVVIRGHLADLDKARQRIRVWDLLSHLVKSTDRPMWTYHFT